MNSNHLIETVDLLASTERAILNLLQKLPLTQRAQTPFSWRERALLVRRNSRRNLRQLLSLAGGGNKGGIDANATNEGIIEESKPAQHLSKMIEDIFQTLNLAVSHYSNLCSLTADELLHGKWRSFAERALRRSTESLNSLRNVSLSLATLEIKRDLNYIKEVMISLGFLTDEDIAGWESDSEE